MPADASIADASSSGEVASDVVTDHPCPNAPLYSRKARHWRVRVRVRVRTDLGWTG
ncbi:hypothetical protein [Streptomyces sp. RP5T]|uniref:hypothetical protein n=1 Tax=Streptomyces sp. RP5T TaxID=2490848 RepID=UPI00163AD8F3|nr:hypothetical protein [Streptomyces sp. RP5T]